MDARRVSARFVSSHGIRCVPVAASGFQGIPALSGLKLSPSIWSTESGGAKLGLRQTVSCRAVSYLIDSCRFVSYHVVSCRIVSFLVASISALSLVFPGNGVTPRRTPSDRSSPSEWPRPVIPAPALTDRVRSVFQWHRTSGEATPPQRMRRQVRTGRPRPRPAPARSRRCASDPAARANLPCPVCRRERRFRRRTVFRDVIDRDVTRSGAARRAVMALRPVSRRGALSRCGAADCQPARPPVLGDCFRASAADSSRPLQRTRHGRDWQLSPFVPAGPRGHPPSDGSAFVLRE